MSLSYQESGDRGSHSLIFLHGFLGSRHDWDSVVSHFPQYRCIATDLPGHGKSELSLETLLDVESQAKEGASLLDALEISQAHFVGYSWGGRVLLSLQEQRAEIVRSMALLSTSPGIIDEGEREKRVKEDERWAERIEEDFGLFLEEWYAQPLFQHLKSRSDLFEKMLSARKRNSPRAMAEVIVKASPGRNPHHWQRLTALTIPVLILTGSLDEKYAGIASHMATRNRNFSVDRVAKAGHCLHLEQPMQVTNRLQRFLGEIK